MIEEYKKIGILSGIAGIMFVLFLVFLFVDISFGPIQISSINSIRGLYDEITNKEAELVKTQSTYNATLSSLERAKKSFETQKSKYEAISDETIKVIKEATTQEEYSIEYMWIRLGNYAKMNNLEIILIEPGGGQETDTSDTTSNTTTSTPVTKSTTSNSTVVSSDVTSDSADKVDFASAKNVETNALEDTEKEDEGGFFTSNRGDTFKIQVSGSYMNVSDFVFAVENDNELRFKLDNISMEYVSGTTIKTTFDVKNMVITK